MSKAIQAVLRRSLSQALATGDLGEAALLLERLRREDPLSVETRGLELSFLLQSNRASEARSLAEQLLRLFPGSARIQYLAGRAAYRVKDYRAAEERFRESGRIWPDWRSSWLLAKSLTQQGKFQEAASILEPLLPEHPECYLDLAWLQERREQYERALEAVEKYLEAFPDSEPARAQRLRLRARVMDPQDLVSETQSVLEFGEEVAESVLPQFLEALFRTGQAAQAREFVAERRRTVVPQTAANLGWICYRYQAFELAMDLFVDSFGVQSANVKFLSAIEFAAKRSGRVRELLRLYQSHAAADRRLYGRMRSLQRHLSR